MLAMWCKLLSYYQNILVMHNVLYITITTLLNPVRHVCNMFVVTVLETTGGRGQNTACVAAPLAVKPMAICGPKVKNK